MTKSNNRSQNTRKRAPQSAAVRSAAVPPGFFYRITRPPYTPPVAVDVIPMRRWIHIIFQTPKPEFHVLRASDLFPGGRGVSDYKTCFIHQVLAYSKGSVGFCDFMEVQPSSSRENERGNADLPILTCEAPEPGTRASVGWAMPPSSGFSGPWSNADTTILDSTDTRNNQPLSHRQVCSIKPVNFTGHVDFYVDASYV